MLELVQAGGWLMLPIILCSIIAIAIIIERFWTLNAARIAPQNILAQVWAWLKNDQLDSGKLQQLRLSSPLGQILAAGLLNSKYGRSAMVDSIEQASSQVIHEMERYLNTLGTLAAVTPLLGLLGTVVGMIRVFSEIMLQVREMRTRWQEGSPRRLSPPPRACLWPYQALFFPIFYA